MDICRSKAVRAAGDCVPPRNSGSDIGPRPRPIIDRPIPADLFLRPMRIFSSMRRRCAPEAVDVDAATALSSEA